MKKLFLVKAETTDWDEYEGLVILADNIQEAREIISKGRYGDNYFNDDQGEITYTEISLNEAASGVVLESYIVG